MFQLQNGPHSAYYNTLNLYAYGTYKQYLENKDKLLELSPTQKKKLQHLTIVTLSTRTKVCKLLPYNKDHSCSIHKKYNSTCYFSVYSIFHPAG